MGNVDLQALGRRPRYNTPGGGASCSISSRPLFYCHDHTFALRVRVDSKALRTDQSYTPSMLHLMLFQHHTPTFRNQAITPSMYLRVSLILESYSNRIISE